MINNFKFIHFFTPALIVEVFMLYLFRFTKSPFSGKSINKWYSNYHWSAIILDVASVIIGFYLARYLSADYNSFFWLWVVFQWTISIALLLIVKFYLTNRLYKSRAIINP